MGKHRDGWAIEIGMDVVGADGEKLGVVQHLQRNHVVVEKGWLFHTDYEIPLGKVTAVDEKVHLAMTKEQIQHGGWDEAPSAAGGGNASDNSDSLDSIGLPD